MKYTPMRIGNDAALMILILIHLSGCGGSSGERDLATVSGTVTVAGQPLRAGQVTFHSDEVGAGAVASLDEGGGYHVDGKLPAGNYVVYLTGQELIGQTNDQGVFQPVTVVPLEGVASKYQTAQTTDLKAALEPGRNTIDFALE